MKFILTLLLFFSWTRIDAAQVVVVTGASRGIGFAIAERLCEKGYTVYAGKRKTSKMLFLSSLQEKHPERLRILDIDVTDQQEIDCAIKEIIDKEGHIDVLVNNAGIMVYGSVENTTIDEAQAMVDVNLFGPMRMSQAVLPFMREKKRGRIIQIGSRAGFRPLPSIAVYAATKFALVGLSESMAATLKAWDIHISIIEPGPVRTDLDFLAPYGARLSHENDPYCPIFLKAGLLDPYSPMAQEPEEIAAIVEEAIEAEKPLFRYQTTPTIQRQAALRYVDITGLSGVDEWAPVLFGEN
ncbi:MAG TPA: SDR family oxidoreductase [Rhabdochlamydiaceae bacterium]